MYLLTGSVTLSGNLTISFSGTPRTGDVFFIEKTASVTVGGGITLTILGSVLDTVLLSKPFELTSVYNSGSFGNTFKVDWNTVDVVGTNQIQDSAITTAKIGTGQVGNTNIANNAVTTSKILDDAVTTLKIDDLAITTNKIDNNAVTTGKIANDAVGSTQLAPISNQTVLGNISGGVANPVEVPIASLITSGNLTETTSAVLTITGGTGAVLGSGTTIEVKANTVSQDGFVTAPTVTNANSYWGTDVSGNPSWRSSPTLIPFTPTFAALANISAQSIVGGDYVTNNGGIFTYIYKGSLTFTTDDTTTSFTLTLPTTPTSTCVGLIVAEDGSIFHGYWDSMNSVVVFTGEAVTNGSPVAIHIQMTWL